MNEETEENMNSFLEKVSQCHAEIAALEGSVLQFHTVFNRQKTDNIKLIEKYAIKFGLNQPELSPKVTVFSLNKVLELVLNHLMLSNFLNQKHSTIGI